MRVFHQHSSRFSLYPSYAPGTVAEQHDVAGIALDGKIFIQGAHHDSFRLEYDGKQRRLRDGATAGDGRQSAAAARSELVVHAVAVEICAVAPSPRRDALRKHFEYAVIGFPAEVAVGVGSLRQREQFIFVPAILIGGGGGIGPRLLRERSGGGGRDGFLFLALERRGPDDKGRCTGLTKEAAAGGTGGYDLLRQNVQGRFGDHDAIQLALPDRSHERATFEQLIASGDEKTSFGDRPAPVPGTPDSLQRYGNRSRGADLYR